MKIDNIDAFNITAMEIFHQSLEYFPIPININSDEMARVLFEYFKISEDDYELQGSLDLLNQTVDQTIIWLKSEGFIKDCGSNDLYASIVLTRKGLNAINAVPISIEDKKSFKEIFKSGVAKASVSTATGLMVEFFKSSS